MIADCASTVMIEDLPECPATLDPTVPADTGVAFDLHDGVAAARCLTRETDRVSLLKANVFALPFWPESFNSIISIGVLHHNGRRRDGPGGAVAWLFAAGW